MPKPSNDPEREEQSGEQTPEAERDRVAAEETRADELTEGDAEHAEAPRAALVIGGGIAGIQAAIDLADSDLQVYLVERSPSLGGRMAQLDKTFPTMDCSI